MGDVAFLLVILGFFALCVLYVRGCDRIVSGADADAGVTAAGEPAGRGGR